MSDEELTKLESKIYIFSVNVFSFTKTLKNQNITNINIQNVFGESGLLYSTFIFLLDERDGENKTSLLLKCIEYANSSAIYLTNIEVKGALLNERVDLIIEIKEILRFLEKLK